MQSKGQRAGCSRLGGRRWVALWVTAAVVGAGSVSADTYTWSANTTGAALDGSGAWNTSAANWVGAGDVHTAWNNAGGDTAAFGAGGTAGTVTAASGLTLGGLLFNAGVSGAYTLNGAALALTGSPLFTANANATVSNALMGPVGFTKSGSGALTLTSNQSSFTGNVTVAQGTLIVNAGNNVVAPTNSALGYLLAAERAIAVANGATLQFNASDTIGNAGSIPLVTLSVENGGTVRNNSSFTTLGPLNLSGGTLLSVGGVNTSYQAYQLKGTVTSGGNAAISTTGGANSGVHLFNGTFAVTSGTLTVSAPLVNASASGGAVGFTKSGAGSMLLTADNSFSGNVTVSNGTLQVGNGGAAGTLGTGVGAVSLVNGDASLVFNRSGSTAQAGAISGSGSVVKQGVGLVTFSGANTYAGGTAISGGVLAVTRTNALPGYATAGQVTLASGAGLSVGVGSWLSADIDALISTGVYGSDTVFGFDTTAGNYAYSGQFALPTVAGLVKTGPNALTFPGGTGFAGGVTALGGILQADFGAGLPASTNVTLSDASLSSANGSIVAALGTATGQITVVSGTASGFSAVGTPLTVNLGGAGAALSWGSAAFNPSVLILNDTGANTNLTLINGLSLNSATRTVNVNATAAGAAAEISGLIANGSGAAGFIKGGAGKLVLSAANSYSGGTTINSGTLMLSGGNNRLNTSGTVTLNSGAVLDLGGYSQSLSVAGFVFNGGTLQNGVVSLSNASWSPGANANVSIGVGGGIVCPNRLLLNNRQTLTLAPGAGSVCFGGDTGGSANYIGVDGNTTNAITVNGGSLDLTNSASGAGYLRIAANAGPPVGYLTVNAGAVNVGHSMNMGARWDNGVVACTGVATLTLTNGEVNVGTGTSTGTGGGNRGWLYMGNGAAGTVSRSTINLNGGTLSLSQLEAGAYGTHAFNFNGGTLKARTNNLTFFNGANLACSVGAGNAVIDTAGFKVGIAANLLGSGLAGGLVKRGSGTLVLGGSNTYSGVTSVEQGTLTLPARSYFPTNGTTLLAAEALGSLKLRLDASDASTLFTNANGSGAVTVSGQPVGYWGDLSGNNKPGLQTTTNQRPTYVTGLAAFNGLPALQFDGTDDEITSLLNINASSISNLTVMMVFRQLTYKVNGGLWGHDDGGWDRIQLLNFGGVGLNNIATSGTSAGVNGMNTNSALIYTAVLKNGVTGGSYVYVNGRSDSTNGLPAFTSSEGTGQALFTLGNISPGNAYRGNIQIGEVMVFNAALSDAARRNAEAYLQDKWVGLAGRANVASGAVLDLNGSTQALASVSGAGTVSNGTLTVTEPLSPAGDDALGTLRVSNVALNGTLRVNVTLGGACDLLECAGSLALNGLALRVADLGLLSRARTYTVITCSGPLTGGFASTNLPANWDVRYDPSGTVTFYYAAPGTLIMVQ